MIQDMLFSASCLADDIGTRELANTPGPPPPPSAVATAPKAARPATPTNKAEPVARSSAADTAHLVPGAPLPDDPFAPYVEAGAPEILREIPPPENTPPVPENVSLRHFIFKSLTVETPEGPAANEIYAVVASPTNSEGRLPGVLVLHGGGGTCDVLGALRRAQHGYVAVAVDLPSIGSPKKQTNSSGAWKKLPYGKDRFKVTPDIKAGKLFDAVVAGLQGFKLLQSQPDVRRDRLGITGVSWGGYMTTMLSGLLGDQVRASWSIFGCGFYDEATYAKELDKFTPQERVTWVKYMDAGYRAANIRSHFFFAAASNDHFFYPPAVIDTYKQIPGEKNLLFVPNVNHQVKSPADGVDASSMSDAWFDFHLKGVGDMFPRIIHAPPPENSTQRGTVAFLVEGKHPVSRARVFYSQEGPHWKDRVWKSLDATPHQRNGYTAIIPPEAVSGGTDWFALVTDERGISVSSLVTRVGATIKPEYSLMPVGDSITAGAGFYVVYRELLLNKLKTAGYHVRYTGTRSDPSAAGSPSLPHQGYGGKNTRFLADIFESEYSACPADIILLHSGHNRSVEQKSVADIIADTRRIIETARRLNPDVIVLVAQVIPAGKLPKYSYIPELNRELAKFVADFNVSNPGRHPVVPVNQAEGFDWRLDAVADHVHPNASGAAKMANRWFDALVALLSK
ncbi:MAG: GDSL-type esterase/lipase family protein [Opitutaceae bacterium]|nr:GDSL-type esterase/lipase family protein [Opitutaceae bacterium]